MARTYVTQLCVPVSILIRGLNPVLLVDGIALIVIDSFSEREH